MKKNWLVLIAITFITSSFSIKQEKLIVSNISKTNYAFVDSFKIGSPVYVDRKFGAKKFPSFLLNSLYIKTSVNDRDSKGNDFLSFEVNQKVTVYVAHCSNIKVVPEWLKNNFERTDYIIEIDGDIHNIYKKDFKKGKIYLGGNLESDKEEDYGMYAVFVTPFIKIPSEVTYLTSEPLRDYSSYIHNQTLNIPKFVYQSSSDSILQTFRSKFQLDSIAGQGDELSKIINLMKWVHYRVKHDGDNSNVPKSSLDIINYVDKTEKGVNCRLVAIVLNDCYLAYGFKARIVECAPHEDYSNECHVTNVVFSKTLNKWVYMDPSFMVYVTNKDGILMNHNEFRESLIKKSQININTDFNWNGQAYSGGSMAYLTYMKKNLFRFSCPLNSHYGYETNKTDRIYIKLNPKGYKEKETKYNVPVRSSNVINYTIQDDLVFWDKPDNI